jgi:hypothetical protein
MLMNNSNDNIGNRARDLPACSAVEQTKIETYSTSTLLRNKTDKKYQTTLGSEAFVPLGDDAPSTAQITQNRKRTYESEHQTSYYV